MSLALQGNIDDQSQTFITVSAWLLVVVGAFTALQSLLNFFVWTFFYPGDQPSIQMSLNSAIPFVLAIAAVFLGLSVLNRKEKALGKTVLLLWIVVLWMVFGLVREVADMMPVSEYLPWSDRFSTALTISDFVNHIATTVACAWLARRLSSPSIQRSYVA